MKKKFIVESLSTFYEIHVVEAENEEQAKEIAKETDWNMSDWLGQTFIDVRDYTEEEIQRFYKRDKYFFKGYTTMDVNGDIYYMHPDGKINKNMPVIRNFDEKNV